MGRRLSSSASERAFWLQKYLWPSAYKVRKAVMSRVDMATPISSSMSVRPACRGNDFLFGRFIGLSPVDPVFGDVGDDVLAHGPPLIVPGDRLIEPLQLLVYPRVAADVLLGFASNTRPVRRVPVREIRLALVC